MRTTAMAAALALAVWAWAGPCAGPARAEETAEQRLERLEESMRAQGAEIARLRADLAARAAVRPAPVPAPAAGTVVAAVDDPARAHAVALRTLDPKPSTGGLRWGGYGTIEWISPSNANSFFDLHRLVLSMSAPITRCIDFSAEVEFEHGGWGGTGNPIDGEVIVEQATFLFRLNDWFRPKAGALLVPFGRSNLYHDDPIHDFTLRPWTARFLVPTGWGVPGVGVEGAVPLGCHTLTYDVVANNGVSDAFHVNNGIRPARQNWRADNNENKQVFGRAAVAWNTRWFSRLETGVSGTYGRYDVADQNDLTGYAFDLLARVGPFEAKGEYVRYDLERDAADPAGSIEGLDGLWVEAAWHFMPCPWRKACTCLVEDTSHFTLAVRYMHTDLHDQVTGASFRDDLESWGVGLNYRITERTVIRIDHTWFDAVNQPDVRELTVSLSTYF